MCVCVVNARTRFNYVDLTSYSLVVSFPGSVGATPPPQPLPQPQRPQPPQPLPGFRLQLPARWAWRESVTIGTGPIAIYSSCVLGDIHYMVSV